MKDNKSPATFLEALETFENLEQELNLPEWEIEGVYIWKILRSSTFIACEHSCGLLENEDPNIDRTRQADLWNRKRAFKEFFTRNPYFNSHRNIQRVVLTGPRKYDFNGHIVDPLSYPIWSGNHESSSIVIARDEPTSSPVTEGKPSLRSLYIPIWVAVQATKVRLHTSDLEKIKNICNSLGLNQSDYINQIILLVKRFIAKVKIFKIVLKKLSPKYLYTVFGLAAWHCAAQSLGIQTIEFQHGAIGRGHPAYDFRGWSEVPYSPDHFLAFGADWFKDVSFPPITQIHEIGSPYIEHLLENYKNKTARRDHQLLVLSQPIYVEFLIRELAAFVKLCPNWRIVIRPHPLGKIEYIRNIISKYPHICSNNITIDKTTPLIEQAYSSWAALSVNSTAAIESLLAGCRVVLLESNQQVQYYQKLIDTGNITTIKNGQELASSIGHLPIGNARRYYSVPPKDIVSVVEG